MILWSMPLRPDDICHSSMQLWSFNMPCRPDDIYHHGILGQHWGDRNGPPYPLGTKTSQRIKKRGNKERQARYKERRDKLQSGKIKRRAKDNIGMSMFMEQSIDNVWNEVMSDGQTQVAKLLEKWEKESDHGDKILRYSEEAYRPGSFVTDKITGEKKPIGPLIDEDTGNYNADYMIHINPRGTANNGQKNNCMKCTSTAILQNMGYVGLSAGRCTYGIQQDAIPYWFDGVESSHSASSDVDSKLSAFGPGSFGGINVNYSKEDETGSKKRIGGHEIFWRVNNNGEVSYYDGQTGEATQYRSYEQACSAYGADTDMEARIDRCDKAKPNWEHMAEDGVIRDTVWDQFGGKVRNKNTGRVVSTW